VEFGGAGATVTWSSGLGRVRRSFPRSVLVVVERPSANHVGGHVVCRAPPGRGVVPLVDVLVEAHVLPVLGDRVRVVLGLAAPDGRDLRPGR
jgi:hypothetical protein